MEKIEFDSFYKFIVFVGIVLLVAPLALCHFMMSGSYDVLISQAEYDGLSEISLQYIGLKSKFLFVAFKYVPIAAVFLMIVGLILIVVGCIFWYRSQKVSDVRAQLAAQREQLEMKKLSDQEVNSKLTKEAEEELQSEDNLKNTKEMMPDSDLKSVKAAEVTASGGAEVTTEENERNRNELQSQDDNTFRPEIGDGAEKKLQGSTKADIDNREKRDDRKARQEIMRRSKEAENMAYDYISEHLGNGYNIKKYVRIGEQEYDVVAESSYGKDNLIYEIRYIRSFASQQVIDKVLAMNESVRALNERVDRKYRFVFVAVVDEAKYDAVTSYIVYKLKKYGMEENKSIIFIKKTEE